MGELGNILSGHTTIGLDTNPFIYLFEYHPRYFPCQPCTAIPKTLNTAHLPKRLNRGVGIARDAMGLVTAALYWMALSTISRRTVCRVRQWWV